MSAAACAAVHDLAEQIVAGRRLTRADFGWPDGVVQGVEPPAEYPASELLDQLVGCDLEALGAAADLVRCELAGDAVDLCTILNARAGRCAEDCRYCAQSVCNTAACDDYGFLPHDTIMDAARANAAAHVDRFALVTSGRALSGDEFEAALAVYRRMHDELDLGLCASMGLLEPQQFAQLRDAGVTRYHCNIETSPRFFSSICTTHAFADKLAAIRAAKAAGLALCSGGIIGMGEGWADRLDMALTLSELGAVSIPINVLIAIPGTPLEGMPPLEEPEVLRTVALFRLVNPTAQVRLAGGRALMSRGGQATFTHGASAAITGDMLTTTGTTIASDQKMLRDMGRM